MRTSLGNCDPIGGFCTSVNTTICEALHKATKTKTGKWVPVTRVYTTTKNDFPYTRYEYVDATEPDEIDAVRCSECGEVFDFYDARNWCTQCGAYMKGE